MVRVGVVMVEAVMVRGGGSERGCEGGGVKHTVIGHRRDCGEVVIVGVVRVRSCFPTWLPVLLSTVLFL